MGAKSTYLMTDEEFTALVDEQADQIARLKAQLTSERERVERLRTSLASILAQRPERGICYEIARKALADTQGQGK